MRRALAIGVPLVLAAACGGGGPMRPDGATLSITTTALAPAAPTVTYRVEVEASGGTPGYTWSISAGSLPPGMQLSAHAGVIAGRTLVSGSYPFTLGVTSADGQSASRSFTIEVEPLCRDRPPADVVSLEDANLLAAVRTELQLGPSDDVTCADALGLTILYALNSGVQSLLGIQHFTNLQALYVRGNDIDDISPVSGLKRLQILVAGDNAINDISTLSELSVQLWDVDVGENPIADISAIGALTGTTKLYVNKLLTTDIGPLQGLIQIADVDLKDNPNLTDIRPLLNNPGLTAGDQVNLTNTGVACSDIDILVARGVQVFSDCP